MGWICIGYGRKVAIPASGREHGGLANVLDRDVNRNSTGAFRAGSGAIGEANMREGQRFGHGADQTRGLPCPSSVRIGGRRRAIAVCAGRRPPIGRSFSDCLRVAGTHH